MATSPNFTNTPRVGIALVNTANTNRDGTGTIATVFTAGTNGSRVESVEITARGNTTNNVVRLFVHDGTTAFLLEEVLVPAITASTTVKVFRQTIVFSSPIVLPPNYSLRASTNNAEAYNVIAFGGDF